MEIRSFGVVVAKPIKVGIDRPARRLRTYTGLRGIQARLRVRAPHISHIFVSVVSALLAGRADCAFAQHSGSGHDSGQETARSASAHAGATEGADGQAAAQGNVTIQPAPAATTHTPAPNSP